MPSSWRVPSTTSCGTGPSSPRPACRQRSAAESASRAYGKNDRPASVSTTLRLVRVKSGRPTMSSSCLMRWPSAAGVSATTREAARKFSRRAPSTKQRSESSGGSMLACIARLYVGGQNISISFLRAMTTIPNIKNALLIVFVAACGGPELAAPDPVKEEPPVQQPPQQQQQQQLSGLPCDVRAVMQANC